MSAGYKSIEKLAKENCQAYSSENTEQCYDDGSTDLPSERYLLDA